MAAKQSLAAQQGILSNELKLPAVFSGAAAPVTERFIAPYITFTHPNRKDEWKKICDKFKDVQDGDMFLIESGNITRLTTLKASWMCHQQYWCLTNPAGEITGTSFVEAPSPYKEHIEAVVLVHLEDRIVPANIGFRTTKCGAAHDMAVALQDCQSAAWADRSAAHRETLAVGQPFGRFIGFIGIGPTRTSKSTGMPYRPTQCNVQPTGAPEWRLLKQFSEDLNAQKQLNDAADRFTSRINEMKGKQVK